MKKYDFKNMSILDIEKAILELRAETEAIIKETADIKKETADIKKETEAIKKKGEAELIALKKEGESRHQKNKDEIEAIKKEGEDRHQKNKDEIEAIKKEGEARHQKYLAEIEILRKEREVVEKKLQSTLDGLGFNIGLTTEELFANSIEKTMEIDGVKYYKMSKNLQILDINGNILSEIDIVLFNQKYICILEVKHHAKLEDTIKLLEKTIPNFIKEEKKFEKYTILPFIAGMSFEKNVLQFAKQHNIGLLKYRGEHFKVINK